MTSPSEKKILITFLICFFGFTILLFKLMIMYDIKKENINQEIRKQKLNIQDNVWPNIKIETNKN